MSVHLPLDGYAYLDPSFVYGVFDDLLLPADQRRFSDIGPMQTTEWGLAHAYHVWFLLIELQKCLSVDIHMCVFV